MCMMSKRKAYSMKEQLEIFNKVMNGVTKADITNEYGLQEVTLRGWISEEI